jgi:hypothetical protein
MTWCLRTYCLITLLQSGSRTHASYRTEAPVYIQPMMESYLTRKHSRESHDVWTEYEWGTS